MSVAVFSSFSELASCLLNGYSLIYSTDMTKL